MKSGVMVAVLGLALGLSACASEGNLVGTAADGSPVYGRSFTPNERDGSVKVNCAVVEDGLLTDCRIVSEQPEGMGFGQMVLDNIAKTQARVRPKQDGQIGQRVEFTTRIREQ